MKYKLADVLKNKTQGVNTTTDKIKYVDIGYKIVQAKNIEEYNVTFDENNYIDEETFNRVKENHKLHKGDVLYTNIGSQLGNSALYNSDEKAIITWNVMKLIPNEKLISSGFLCYLLNYNKLKIKTLNSSSTMPFVSGKELMNFEINIPALEIQNKITKILNMIQSKIRLNNQINDNLHKLSDELYKGWFIDYNYPNSNGKLKESSLGLIPEDWRVERLETVAECQNGYAFYKDGYDKDGLMVIDLGNINLNGTFIYTNADKYIMPDRVETDKFNKYKVYKNDLIMVMTDRKATMELLGKTGKIFEDKEFLLNQRMYRIRSKINTNYLYTALNNDLVLNKLKSKALGSVQKYVNTGHINELDILIGTDEVMEKFSNMVDPIYAEIENRTIENTRLENLRDSLLPKLMNGEIDLDKIEI